MASGKITDMRNFELYRNEVLVPFISVIREKLYGFNPGSVIPNELNDMSWIDDGQSQLESILDEKTQNNMAALKIMLNKHSAARQLICHLSSDHSRHS